GERDAGLQPADPVDAQPGAAREQQVVRPLPDRDVDLGRPGEIRGGEREARDDPDDGVGGESGSPGAPRTMVWWRPPGGSVAPRPSRRAPTRRCHSAAPMSTTGAA